MGKLKYLIIIAISLFSTGSARSQTVSGCGIGSYFTSSEIISYMPSGTAGTGS